jgi:formate hydrogenlyase transcriptional activator
MATASTPMSRPEQSSNREINHDNIDVLRQQFVVATEALERKIREQEVLLHISHSMAQVKDRNGLLQIINRQLKELFYFSYSIIFQLTDDRQYMKAFIVDPDTVNSALPNHIQLAYDTIAVNDIILNRILTSEEPELFTIEDSIKKESIPEYLVLHRGNEIRETILISLRIAGEPLGILAFYSDRVNTFTADIQNLVQTISHQLSTAIANIRYHEDIHQRDQQNAALLDVSNGIATLRGREDFSKLLQYTFKKYIPYNDAVILTCNGEQKTLKAFAWYVEQQRSSHPLFDQALQTEYPVTDTSIINSHVPVIIDVDELLPVKPQLGFVAQAGIKGLMLTKLLDGNKLVGLLVFLSAVKQTFTAHHVSLMQRISYQVSMALTNIRGAEKIKSQLEEINRYKQQLEEEKLYLQEEVRHGNTFSDIIGKSKTMQHVFYLLSQVAASNSTVLILGETGTGKELIARAIHNFSGRKDKLMVKVNCASIPSTLIESELFGHEKGSFTGAVERRIGKFELSNGGTLFLDEVGEMPLEMQAKLLRAIQEKEIERIGGKAPIKVDVRILAATNRNLQKEVTAGKFRSDLYYRLNVFPIIIPPLRDRMEDIPLLTQSFIDRYSKYAGKEIMSVSAKVLKALQSYSWPGNVRELEHLIERSILLATGNIIKEIHLPVKETGSEAGNTSSLRTLEEVERDYILEVLKRCNGKIYGTGGAAELLGLKRSTLISRMNKLGIEKTETSYIKK